MDAVFACLTIFIPTVEIVLQRCRITTNSLRQILDRVALGQDTVLYLLEVILAPLVGLNVAVIVDDTAQWLALSALLIDDAEAWDVRLFLCTWIHYVERPVTGVL